MTMINWSPWQELRRRRHDDDSGEISSSPSYDDDESDDDDDDSDQQDLAPLMEQQQGDSSFSLHRRRHHHLDESSSSSLSTLSLCLFRCSLTLNLFLLGILLWIIVLVWVLPVDTSVLLSSHHSAAARTTTKQSLSTTTNATTTTDNNNNNNNNNNVNILIYGHVHIAKTAGTDINGILASRFERVCGNKGYSYDAYRYNLQSTASSSYQLQQPQQQNDNTSTTTTTTNNSNSNNNTTTSIIPNDDLISKQYPGGYNRGKVPLEVMAEIGYEDCDYISQEGSWKFWSNLAMDMSSSSLSSSSSSFSHSKASPSLQLGDGDNIDAIDTIPIANNNNNSNTNIKTKSVSVSLELHIPCRDDPLDHAMSLCNHAGYSFSCDYDNDSKTNTTSWQDILANKCRLQSRIFSGRFSTMMLLRHYKKRNNNHNNNNYIQNVACFSPIPLEPYINYMDQRLQRKKQFQQFQQQQQQQARHGDDDDEEEDDDYNYPYYVHRVTNAQRNKSNECIFQKDNVDFAKTVRQHLLDTYEYFQFCHKCMGSKQELKL